jgi:protein-glutamine gamma-glutamyltransferase
VVLRMLAFAVPVALVLFLLFPRVPGPFWACPRAAPPASPACPTRCRRATISQLIQSDEVAFRVSFEGPVPPPAVRYWRGPVLERFDGWTWRETSNGCRCCARAWSCVARATAIASPSNRTGAPWLLALDYPSGWSDREAC